MTAIQAEAGFACPITMTYAAVPALRKKYPQASDEERRKVATWVVDNAGELGELEKQIADIWPELERRSAEAAAEAATAAAAPARFPD